MERYPENPSSLNLEGLDGLVFVHSGCHEPLGLELGRTLRAETTEGGAKRETEEKHENKCERVGRPKSENTFWQDLTATGGDVEVDEEGGREFNECPCSMPNTWQTSERM